MAKLSDEVLFEVIRGMNTLRYAQLAGGVFFVYDYCLTFGMEVELIWRSKWNFIKFLYLFQRYLTFYDTFYASFTLQFGKGMSATACESLFYQMGISFVIGIIASESKYYPDLIYHCHSDNFGELSALCSLRIWAVWNQDKRFYIIYPVCVACIWIPGIAAMGFAVTNARYSEAPFPDFVGCFTLDAKGTHLEYVWAALLAYDAVSLLFVVIPGIQHYRNGVMINSRLSNVVFRDGVVYYITLFIFSLLNIIFTLTLDAATRSSLATMGRTLHSALASRVLLHMRETVHVDQDIIDNQRTQIHFARTPREPGIGESDGLENNTHINTYGSSDDI